MQDIYFDKYLKYKQKYLELKNQTGNGSLSIPADKDGYTLIIFNHNDLDVDSVLFTILVHMKNEKGDYKTEFIDNNYNLPKTAELFNSLVKKALWIKLNDKFEIIDSIPNIEKKGIKLKSNGSKIDDIFKNKNIIENNNFNIFTELINKNLLDTPISITGKRVFDVLICKIAGFTGTNKIIKRARFEI